MDDDTRLGTEGAVVMPYGMRQPFDATDALVLTGIGECQKTIDGIDCLDSQTGGPSCFCTNIFMPVILSRILLL